jgi:C1A family cysteine protease
VTSSTQHYGWIPDLPDQRDLVHVVPTEVAQALPSAVDLRTFCPAVYDQGKLGSCTANAIAAALAFDQRKLETPQRFTPSRLFIYYNERALQGTASADTGAPLREGMKAVNHAGVCPEDQPEDTANWPYDPTQFASRPPDTCYAEARHVRALHYRRLNHSLDSLKGCLAEGYPFVFGITVYESFESPQVKQTGAVVMPEKHESVIGGHAMMAVGYDDARQALIVRNSWGPNWGDQGYCYLPYDYLIARGLARDFWTIRLITDVISDGASASVQASTTSGAPPAAPGSPAGLSQSSPLP